MKIRPGVGESPESGLNGMPATGGSTFICGLAADNERSTLTTPPPTVIEDGEKLHPLASNSPKVAQLKLTVPVNPLTGVKVILELPCLPAAVIETGVAASVKNGEPEAATRSNDEAEVAGA